MSVTVEVVGEEKLAKDFVRLLERSVKAASTLIVETALAIEEGAKVRAPVDTGRLRASIRPEIANDQLSAEIIADVDYASAVEFGTQDQPAQPFMTPAVEQQRGKMESRLKKLLGEALQ